MSVTGRAITLTILDVLWWRHRRIACRLCGWLKRRDGHDWDTLHTVPARCTWCGVVGWPRI